MEADQLISEIREALKNGRNMCAHPDISHANVFELLDKAEAELNDTEPEGA
jgi:hypothetical protein